MKKAAKKATAAPAPTNPVRENLLLISKGKDWKGPDTTIVAAILPHTIAAASLALSAGDHNRFRRLMDRVEVQLAGVDHLGLLPALIPSP